MRYLGLDLGTKTVGVALSDKTNTIASILKVIRYTEDKYNQMLEEIKKIVKEYQIIKIVLGLPKNMDNSLGFAAERSLKFKEEFAKISNVPIVLFDERLTTIQAENILITADVSRNKRKKVIDGIAAVIILESYMKKEKGI